jgi:hypothetical protein
MERKMDPEKIMTGISKELLAALKVMAKAKTPDEKLKYSEIVKNLCESLGVFLDLINDIVPYDFDNDEDDESIPF